MPSQILMCCVPLGVNNGLASLDVLVSPQLGTQPDVDLMAKWINFVIDTQAKFQLDIQNVAGPIPLKLDASLLRPDLWSKLFPQSTKVGNAYADTAVAAAKQSSSAVAIGRSPASLSDSHTHVHNFYTDVVYKRFASSTKLGVDAPFLTDLHAKAIACHGMYDPTPNAVAQAPGPQSNISGFQYAGQLLADRHRVRVPGCKIPGFGREGTTSSPLNLTIDTTSLVDGSLSAYYSVAMSASGGMAPFHWSISDDNLPNGLSLGKDTGIISGIPLSVGSATLTVSVVDSGSTPATVTAKLPITVLPTQPLNVITNDLPTGIVGDFYSAQLLARGVAPYKWRVSRGDLPDGLVLDSASGVISGTPKQSEIKSFSMEVTDASIPVAAIATSSISLKTIRFPPPPDSAFQALNYLRTSTAFDLNPASGASDDQSARPPHLLYHVNRLLAPPRDNRASRLPSSFVVNSSPPTWDFDKCLAVLQTMPAIMEALGLVLCFTFPTQAIPAGSLVSLNLDKVLPFSNNLKFSVTKTVSTNKFLPMPKPLDQLTPSQHNMSPFTEDGWINPNDGYQQGCLQLDSAAMQTVQFANKCALRKIAYAGLPLRNGIDPSLVISNDEDVDYPILPPSPHTGGLQVWQDNRQQRASEAVTAMPAPGMSPTSLFADDLVSGIAVDVLCNGKPINLTQREEAYEIGSIFDKIHIGPKNWEHGVRTAAIRRSDGNTVAYDVDETVLNWRLGSLVAPPNFDIKKRVTSGGEMSPSQGIPWTNDFKTKLTPSSTVSSPIFGQSYQVAMRPVFVTGKTFQFTADGAQGALLPSQTFMRYELVQGPDVIPVKFTRNYINAETTTLMIVASKLDESLNLSSFTPSSMRVVVPARVTPEVARRHGIVEDKISVGTPVFPLTNGALPTEIISGATQKNESSIAYLPDPLCVGVIATLTTLDGEILMSGLGGSSASVEVPYYEGGAVWPAYTVHFIDLQRAKAGQVVASIHHEDADYSTGAFPFMSAQSQKIVCEVPVGQTVLLVLQPKLDNNVMQQHALLDGYKRAKASLRASDLSRTDICRSTTIRLSHAADRPPIRPTVFIPGAVAPPQAKPSDPAVPVTFTRQPHNTLPVKVVADPLSTAKVEVVATWTDQVDDPNQAAPSLRTSVAQLGQFQISKKSNGQPDQMDVRLPFSDARYRRVSLTAKGLSRLSKVFGAGDGDDLSTDSDPPIFVDFLATAAPGRPDIEAVLPNLHWQNTGERRSRTMGLTIVLGRGWYSSGNEEQLAVITSASPTGDNSSPALTIATVDPDDKKIDTETASAWGLMPDWEFTGTGLTKASLITLQADDNIGNTALSIKEDAKPTSSGVVAIGTESYVAAYYIPRYNEQDQTWYVNLQCTSPPAYGAVVRLIVARRQQNAVAGAELSQLVSCDFTLLSPERCVVMSHTGFFWNRMIHVQIQGVGAYAPDPQKNNSVKLVTQFEVRRASIELTESEGFNWEEADPIDSDTPPAGNILWQKTFSKHLFQGITLVAREKEFYQMAESADPKDLQTRYVYLDAFKVM